VNLPSSIIKTFCAEGGIKDTLSRPFKCSRTPLTRTLKGNEKQLAGNSSYQGKFQRNFDQGKGNLVRVIKVVL